MAYPVFTISSDNIRQGVHSLCMAAELPAKLQAHSTVLIKPNLVEALEPPITTPVDLVDALVEMLQKNCSHLKIVVGEGTGSLKYDTSHCFETLGYNEMASKRKIELVDLNTQQLVRKSNDACKRWPEMYLPRMVYESFLISVPVLKAHSLAAVTLTMKNMMGCAPPAHYRDGNSWGKSAFHSDIQEAVFDLNRYRAPDFTLLDGSVGMAEAHLWGRHCSPPVGRLAASYDPVAIDAYGTLLLDRDWRSIDHIRMADGELGVAEPLQLVEV